MNRDNQMLRLSEFLRSYTMFGACLGVETLCYPSVPWAGVSWGLAAPEESQWVPGSRWHPGGGGLCLRALLLPAVQVRGGHTPPSRRGGIVRDAGRRHGLTRQGRDGTLMPSSFPGHDKCLLC